MSVEDIVNTLCDVLDVDDHELGVTIVPPALSGERPPLDPEQRGLELMTTLGQGGMSVVHLARQRSLDRDVAVKAPPSESTSWQSLLREARILGRLEHPNIVPVHDLEWRQNGTPLLVMKRISGTLWSDVLAESGHPLTADLSDRLGYHLRVLIQVANAVHFAHSRGILHRDIKPDNVMIGEFGEVYLLDWGIAIRDEELDAVEVGPRRFAGSPAYMAPEMIDASFGGVSLRTDVYLLGGTLYEIVCGGVPNRGHSLAGALRSALLGERDSPPAQTPRELVEILERAMSSAPEERYQSADDFRLALIGFLEHRDARELAAEAGRQLVELAAMIERQIEADGDEIRDRFSTCRFSADLALRAHSKDPEALHVRRESRELMARYELASGNPHLALQLLEEIEDPDADLVMRAERAAAVDASAATELAAMRKDVDLSVSARDRSRFVAGLTVFAVGFGLAGIFGDAKAAKTVFWKTVPLLSFFVVYAASLYHFRKRLLTTSVNRRIFMGILVCCAMAVVVRVSAVAVGIEQKFLFAENFAVLATGCAMMVPTVDRRFALPAAVFTAGMILLRFRPEWGFSATVPVYFAAMVSIAWAWRLLGVAKPG